MTSFDREKFDDTPVPFDFAEARAASTESSSVQSDAETYLAAANKDFALAEEAYRKALALEMWRLREEDNVAWTVVGDLARGQVDVARFKRVRDEAEGARTIASHAVYRRSADRRDTERLIDWSARRDLAEGFRPPSGPEHVRPIGAVA